MGVIEDSIKNICSEDEIERHLEELFQIIKNHYERMKLASPNDIDDTMLSYSQYSAGHIRKISEFLSYQMQNEKGIALLDKYEELNSRLFKIRTTILKTHQCLTEFKEELMKTQNEVINNLTHLGKIEKMEEEQKKELELEIRSFYRMGKEKNEMNQRWFIHDTLVEMEAMMEVIQGFYVIWGKIRKETKSTFHSEMY